MDITLDELLTDALKCKLSPKELAEISENIEIIKCEPNKEILSSEKSQSGLYIVSKNKVRVIDHEKKLINTLKKGDVFGYETIFLDNDCESYSVKATQNEVEILFIPDRCLPSILHNHPEIKPHLVNKLLTKRGNNNSAKGFSKPVQLPSNQKKHINNIFPTPTQRFWHFLSKKTKRYPYYPQQRNTDCGVACLMMVSIWHNKHPNINQLCNIANVNRNGAKLIGLSEAARSIGFSAKAVNISLDKLTPEILPAIGHWENNHYIVIYEVTQRHVVIADPAYGRFNLTYAQFKNKWKGITLLLQPNVLLKDTTDESTSLWQLFELIKPYWPILLEVFVASIFIQMFGLINPIFTQIILDYVVKRQSELTLNTFGLGLVIFSLFRVGMVGLRQYLLDHTANKVDISLVAGFIEHTFRLPLSFFESRYVGDIISRIQENHKIQRFLTGEALSILLDLLTVFIYVGLMFWYSWKMALLALLILPPFSLLALVATPYLKKKNREIFKNTSEERRYLIEALTGIGTIKSSGVEQIVYQKWEEKLYESVRSNFSGQVIGNRLEIFSSTIEALINAGLLWFGAWLVIQGELSPGQLVAFNMLIGNIINPFQRLTVLWNEFQEVIVAIERICDVIEAKPEQDLQYASYETPKSLVGSIEFQQVTYRYDSNSKNNILENVSYEIKPKQTVALVGGSGSGKTTLSKLILGLYPPTNGKILIDGKNVSTISKSWLRQHIGVVNQDTFLFGETIRDNITIKHPSASPEEVEKVARLAGADSFIEKMAHRYDTRIGEGGGMLSGGQRQRLAIARALLGNPKILIFDEATSHLDSESEQIIQNNLSEICKNRTTLIIAHRLSTIRNADLILVLQEGVLVESGTHKELINKKGYYYNLNRKQEMGIYE